METSTRDGGGCVGTLGLARPPGPVFEGKRVWASLDFPRIHETIRSSSYSLRVSACERAQRVEVRIDGGPWRACRKASGHWWYDWEGYGGGSHELLLRVQESSGKWGCSPHPRWLQVEPQPPRPA